MKKRLLAIVLVFAMLFSVEFNFIQVSAANVNEGVNWWAQGGGAWQENTDGSVSTLTPFGGNQYALACGNPVIPTGDFSFEAEFTATQESGGSFVGFTFKNSAPSDAYNGFFIQVNEYGTIFYDKLDGNLTSLPQSGNKPLINYTTGAFNKINVVFTNNKVDIYINNTKQVDQYALKAADVNGWISLSAQTSAPGSTFKNVVINNAGNTYKSFTVAADTIGSWKKSIATTNPTTVSSTTSGLNYVCSATTTATDYAAIRKTFGGSSNFTIEYIQKVDKFGVAGAAFGIGFSADTIFTGNTATNGLTVRYNMPTATTGQLRFFDGTARKDNSAGFVAMPTNTYTGTPTVFSYKKVKIEITKTTLQVWSENDLGNMVASSVYPIPALKQTDNRNVLTIFAMASSATFGDVRITHDGVTSRDFSNTIYYVSSTDGNDGNSGISSNSPWKTFANFTSSKVLQPGDQVLLKRGDTWNERLTLQGAGSITNWIYVGAYGDNNKPKPIISLNNGRDDIAVLYQDIISGGSVFTPIGYAQFENLDIRNTRLGIYVRQILSNNETLSKGLRITNCDFSNINNTSLMNAIGAVDADVTGELAAAKGNLPYFNGAYMATGGGANEYLFPTSIMIGGTRGAVTATSNPLLSEITVQNCVFEKAINGIMSWMYAYNDGSFKNNTANWLVDNCVITGTVNGIIGFDSVNGGYTSPSGPWGKVTNCRVLYGNDVDTFRDGTTGLIISGAKNFVFDNLSFGYVKRNGRPDGCGFDFEGNNENIILQNSTFHNNEGQAILMMASSGLNSNITIQNNLFYNNLVNRTSSLYRAEMTIFNNDNINIQLLNNTRYSTQYAERLAADGFGNLPNGVTESGTVAGNLSTYVEPVQQVSIQSTFYGFTQIMVKVAGSITPMFIDDLTSGNFNLTNLPIGVNLLSVTKLNYNTVILNFDGIINNKAFDFSTNVTVNANQFIKPISDYVSGKDSMGNVQNPLTYNGALSSSLNLAVPVSFGSFKVTQDSNRYVTNVDPNATSSSITSGLYVSNYASVAFDSLGAGDKIKTGSTMVVSINGTPITTYTMVIYGDVDNSGVIGLDDLVSVRDYMLETGTLTGASFKAADLYNEGKITLNSLVGLMAFVSESGSINQNN